MNDSHKPVNLHVLKPAVNEDIYRCIWAGGTQVIAFTNFFIIIMSFITIGLHLYVAIDLAIIINA